MLFSGILLVIYTFKPNILGSIYFKSGEYKIENDQFKVLKKVADTLKKDSLLLIDCIGYTDRSGSFKQNLRIALKRAQEVKKALVKKFNINPERIFTIAFGADTTSHLPPDKKRRTDIIVHPPAAILTSYSNRVILQPFFIPTAWLQPKGDDPLYRFYKVKTERASLADIYFPRKGTIELGSEALLIIYGSLKRKKRHIPDITLSTGRLYAILQKDSKTKKLNVKTPSAEVKFVSARGKVGVNKNKMTLVSLFEGYAEVYAKGKKVKLKSGEGTFVEKGEPPAPPEKLPSPPEIHVKKSKLHVSDTLILTWKGKSTFYHIQFFSDSSLKKVLLDTIVNQNYFNYPLLSPGILGIRISSMDKKGIESDYSNPLFLKILPQKHSQLPPTQILKLTKIRHNLYRITLKSVPEVLLYIGNNIIETDKNGKVTVTVKKHPYIIVKAVDKTGNSRIDTLKLPTEKFYKVGVYLGYAQGSLLPFRHDLFTGIEAKMVFYRGFGAGGGVYTNVAEKARYSCQKALAIFSYEFELTYQLHPEIIFGYGILSLRRLYIIQTLGTGINVKLSHTVYLFPHIRHYSLWPGDNNFTEFGAFFFISFKK